jgi:hypothetical protein
MPLGHTQSGSVARQTIARSYVKPARKAEQADVFAYGLTTFGLNNHHASSASTSKGQLPASQAKKVVINVGRNGVSRYWRITSTRALRIRPGTFVDMRE